MSPASYLTAPPRVAATSVPNARRYDDFVPWWTWVALGIFLVAVLAAGTLATSRAVGAIRAAQSAQGTITSELGRLLKAAEDLERRLGALEERRAQIEERTEALKKSLAKLSLLGWALADSREAVTRLRRAVPRK
jgi:hypothetical protein